MRTLVHLSDLHFGRVNHVVAEALRHTVSDLRPDVLVVSGDFTQRARSWQFRAARAFLDSLPQPQLIVPGNHDVPLHNVFARFLTPLRNYRRHITDDVRPSYLDEEIALIGTDTTRSFTIGGGGIRKRELHRIRNLLKEIAPSVVRVLVAHHPFDEPHAGAAFGRARPGPESPLHHLRRHLSADDRQGLDRRGRRDVHPRGVVRGLSAPCAPRRTPSPARRVS